MSKIQELTTEQWAVVDANCERASKLERVDISPESLRPAVDALYAIFDQPPPKEILVFPSVGALTKWQIANGQEKSTDWIGVYSRIWHERLATAIEIGLLPEDEESKELLSIISLSRSLYDAAVYDTHFCAVPLPSVLHRDELLELHCADGPAIAWEDQAVFAWHGVLVPEALILDPESMTGGILEKPTEIRRAWAERLGWPVALKKLDAKELDRATDSATGLEYVLFSIPSGERVLTKQSPPLLSGQQPVYAEQVSRECQTALGARVWQLPYVALGLPQRSAQDCDRDASLTYLWER